MRIFPLGTAVTHPNYVGHIGTIISPDMTASGHYKVLINNNHVMLHNEQLTEKNNMSEVETLEHHCFAVKAEVDKLREYMLNNGQTSEQYNALFATLPAYATTKLTITEIRKDMFERYKQMFENTETKTTEIEVVEIDIDSAVTFTLPVVNFDLDKIKTQVLETIEPIKGMQVTENTLKQAEKIRANLNKFGKAIDDRRKLIIKEISAPIDKVDADIKQLVALVKTESLAIDTQVKDFERREADAKRIQINEIITAELEKTNLTQQYAAQLTILDVYLQKGWTLTKIAKDVTDRAAQLVLAQDNAIALETAKANQIANRQALINNQNETYGFNFSYENYPIKTNIGGYTDEQVYAMYKQKAETRNAAQAKAADIQANTILSQSDKQTAAGAAQDRNDKISEPSVGQATQNAEVTHGSFAILSEITIKLSIDGGTTARSQAAFAKIKELFIKSATAEIQTQLAKFEKLGVKCDFNIN